MTRGKTVCTHPVKSDSIACIRIPVIPCSDRKILCSAERNSLFRPGRESAATYWNCSANCPHWSPIRPEILKIPC